MINYFFKKITKKSKEENQLEEVKSLLFPPFSKQKTENNDHYLIDSSADRELEAALIDLEDGISDDIVKNTIKDILYRLHKIRKILNPQQEINNKANIIFIGNKKDKIDPLDSIISKEIS